MQESRDLRKVVTGIEMELKGLDVPCERVSIDLVDPTERTMRIYHTWGDDPAEVVEGPPLSLDADDHGREYWARWQEGVPFRRFATVEDIRTRLQSMVEGWVT